MKIKDKFKAKRPLVSFEIFPPKANYPISTIYNSIDELYNLDPDAHDLNTDIDFLKRKMDAGADFLVTQMFFDNELFYDFYDKAIKNGINLPIITGIMPILNKNQINTIVNLTGNSIPKKFERLLNKYENNPDALKEAGMSYAVSQIIDLLSWEVDGIHIYTMNKPSTARKILGSISAIRSVLTN